MNFCIGHAKIEIDLKNVFDKRVTVKLDIPLGLFRLDLFTTINPNENTPVLIHAYVERVTQNA